MTVWALAASLWLAQPSTSPTLTPGISNDPTGPQFLIECGSPKTRAVQDLDIVLRLDGQELPTNVQRIVGGTVSGVVGAGVEPAPASGPSARVQLVLLQDMRARRHGGRFDARLYDARLHPLDRGRHRLAVRCLGQWSNEVTFEWEP
jgi:hypothetical protein